MLNHNRTPAKILTPQTAVPPSRIPTKPNTPNPAANLDPTSAHRPYHTIFAAYTKALFVDIALAHMTVPRIVCRETR